MTVIPHVATRSEILNAINACYKISSDINSILDVVSATEDGALELAEADKGADITGVFQTGKRMDLTAEVAISAPVIKLVNLIITEAMQHNVSDIHIEPYRNTVNIRFRRDGVLTTYTQVPRWMHSAIVSRIKIMSKLDISNRKTPQDGSMKIKSGSGLLDLRISTLPSHVGEKVVIRLLNPEEEKVGLESVGLNDAELGRIKHIIKNPQGIILVTGPTGSGKTTTLHGMLREIRTEGINIITIEDPVEYELEGITQVQVQEKAGLTFANALRSILRQDPDVVMVGEIRDHETAEIAMRASMTGHLVLSTLHTMGTAATIMRLYDIGVEPYLISSSILSIITQRLVRVNCEHCVSEYVPDNALLKSFPNINMNARFMKGKGCNRCNNTGYNGRVGVFEIMEITPSLRKAIADKTASGELYKLARQEGMRLLYDSAMEKVYKGITSLEEVLRVVTVKDMIQNECPVCGRIYTDKECPFCGVTTAEVCKVCGNAFEVEWRFCPFCGKTKDAVKLLELPAIPKVLIVDDEAGILKMVELALKPLNLEIHTSQNGKEALDRIAQISPNLVITDINMPVMDGFELIKELRQKVNTMFIPIIILSSRDTAEDKLKGFTFGSDDYITKPFDYTELQARVKRLLQRTYG
jgi:type IV pilus assembly protein PilB